MNAISLLPPMVREPETEAACVERHRLTLRRLTEICLVVAEGAAEQALLEQADERARREEQARQPETVKVTVRGADCPDLLPSRPDAPSPNPLPQGREEAFFLTDVSAGRWPEAAREPRVPSGSAALVLARLTQAIKQVIALDCRLGTLHEDAPAPAEQPAERRERPFNWRRDDLRPAIILDAVDRAIAASRADEAERRLMRARAEWELGGKPARDALEADPAEEKLAAVVATIERRNGFSLDLARDIDRVLQALSPYDWAGTGFGRPVGTGPPDG